jgi:hypothetical protein
MLRTGLAWFPISVLVSVAGCGDDSSTAVPFSSIPRDKKLTELSPEERQGVCDWGAGIAGSKLPAPGTRLNCDGRTITFNGSQCTSTSATPPACTATIGQWEVCFPAFIDRLAQDPCLIFDLGLSQSDLELFVNETPGCEGLGPCAFTIP